jgi:hypothetical protein
MIDRRVHTLERTFISAEMMRSTGVSARKRIVDAQEIRDPWAALSIPDSTIL